jgi:hypothetical protein
LEFKETYLSHSESGSNKSSRRGCTKACKPSKEDTPSKSKSKSTTKEAIVHLLKAQEKQAKQFAQLVKRLTPPSSKNDSNGSSLFNEDDDHVFHLCSIRIGLMMRTVHQTPHSPMPPLMAPLTLNHLRNLDPLGLTSSSVAATAAAKAATFNYSVLPLVKMAGVC